LKQTTDDRISGADLAGSRERGFSVGPGVVYATPAVILVLNYQFELGIENRFEGERATLEAGYKFR
jgi:hypothetical protein